MYIDEFGIHVYSCKDGRVRAYDPVSKKIVSYPKLLMERVLGRPLAPYEDVHHIDENPLNNSVDNLEVRNHGEHQREHSTKYTDKTEICEVCGKSFIWTSKRQSRYYADLKRGKHRIKTCSKSCSSLYGRLEQLGRNI